LESSSIRKKLRRCGQPPLNPTNKRGIIYNLGLSQPHGETKVGVIIRSRIFIPLPHSSLFITHIHLNCKKLKRKKKMKFGQKIEKRHV
jgi:hypothetical protein